VTSRQKQWLDQVGSVLESLNQGVIISDEDRRIIFANSMFLEMGKMSAEDILGFDPTDALPQSEDFFQRIHPDDRPGFRELAETSIREKADYRVVHPDGRVRDIHVIAHPVLSTCGELVEFVGT
jgi:PAS domain-containing protein